MSTPYLQLLISAPFPKTYKARGTNFLDQKYIKKSFASAENLNNIRSTKHENSSYYSSPANYITCHNSRFDYAVATDYPTRITEFEFKTYITLKVDSVNIALEEAMIGFAKAEPMQLYESMRYTISNGGKRAKSVLCIAACEAVGGHESAAMPAACALEMIQTNSLMLDDLPCADNDDFRRGKPSNHKIFGENVTINAANALLALAFEHLAAKNNTNSNHNIMRAIGELGRATGIHGLTGGQVAEHIYMEDGIDDVDMELLEFIACRKTGALIECSANIGAILGGGSDDEVALLRKFGRCVGHMFQVVDDLLDVEDDSTDYKKATYPKLIGVDKSKKLVLELRREAEEMLLAAFEPHKAAPLIGFANYIAYRDV